MIFVGRTLYLPDTGGETSRFYSNNRTIFVMLSVKIAVVGPPEAGKTTISNYLSEATSSSSKEYHPTQGVRILEFESEYLDEEKSNGVEVELWDCAGSKKFETCWPAFSKNTNGVLIVTPYKPNLEADMDRWYSYFVKRQNLSDAQCLLVVVSNKIPPQSIQISSTSKIAGIQCITVHLDDLEKLKYQFSMLLSYICQKSKEFQNKAEQDDTSY